MRRARRIGRRRPPSESPSTAEPAAELPTAPEQPELESDLLEQFLSDEEPELSPGDGERTVADRLVEIAVRAGKLFHSPDGVGYINVSVGDHEETHPILAISFRRYLTAAYYRETGKAAAPQSLKQALAAIEAQAIFDGPEHEVYLRVAPLPDRPGVAVDLGNASWNAAVIDEDGWSVGKPPVFFRRSRGMLALPDPVHGGSLEEVMEQLGVSGRNGMLVLGWLIGAFRADGPYFVLVLLGEQGSLKTTTARKLRSLADPNAAALRAQPREMRDLAIASRNSRAIALDNLSNMPDWLSDGLCRLATGGGFATRELYSDTEETIIDAISPVLLNGIDGVATRGDLLDRALVVTLPRVTEYKPEAEVWASFNEAAPRLLGAVLDAVSLAVRRERETEIPADIRMADPSRWVAAALKNPFSATEWLDAVRGVRVDAYRTALDASMVGPLLEEIGRRGWTGTASELLRDLTAVAEMRGTKATRSRWWPTTAKAIANEVRRLAPALRGVGVAVDMHRQPMTGRRLIALGGVSDRHDGHDSHGPSWLIGSRRGRSDGSDGSDDELHEDDEVDLDDF